MSVPLSQLGVRGDRGEAADTAAGATAKSAPIAKRAMAKNIKRTRVGK